MYCPFTSSLPSLSIHSMYFPSFFLCNSYFRFVFFSFFVSFLLSPSLHFLYLSPPLFLSPPFTLPPSLLSYVTPTFICLVLFRFLSSFFPPLSLCFLSERSKLVTPLTLTTCWVLLSVKNTWRRSKVTLS